MLHSGLTEKGVPQVISSVGSGGSQLLTAFADLPSKHTQAANNWQSLISDQEKNRHQEAQQLVQQWKGQLNQIFQQNEKAQQQRHDTMRILFQGTLSYCLPCLKTRQTQFYSGRFTCTNTVALPHKNSTGKHLIT